MSEPTEVLKLLAFTPARLAELATGCESDAFTREPSPGEWPACEILAHLRAGAQTWGGYITAMLEADHPTKRYVSPRSLIRPTNFQATPFEPALKAYTSQRAELIATLAALSEAQWARGASFTGRARGAGQTVLSAAENIVAHERPHLLQLEQTLAAVTGRAG